MEADHRGNHHLEQENEFRNPEDRFDILVKEEYDPCPRRDDQRQGQRTDEGPHGHMSPRQLPYIKTDDRIGRQGAQQPDAVYHRKMPRSGKMYGMRKIQYRT